MEETRYGLKIAVQLAFAEAITRAIDALKSQGFGVLTTIDVQQTLKAKLDRDFQKYTILRNTLTAANAKSIVGSVLIQASMEVMVFSDLEPSSRLGGSCLRGDWFGASLSSWNHPWSRGQISGGSDQERTCPATYSLCGAAPRAPAV